MRAGEGRIAALDVLRGVAIIGTFASNVWLFTTPGGPVAYITGFGTADPVQTGLQVLSNGKFLGLLTLLFGVGMELQYRSAVRRGKPWPGRYLARAAILFVEGLLHYLLVFEFDVLMGYAITSIVVAYLIGRSDRVVRAWMLVVGSLHVAVILGLTALMAAAPPTTAGAVQVRSTGSWPAQVVERIVGFPFYRLELFMIVPSGIVLFLVGARLARAGAFADTAAGSRIRRRLVALGVAAVPLNVLTAYAGPAWVLVDRYLLPPVIALGLLGAVTALVLATRGGRLRAGFAAVGRTALSCYVAQNLLAGAICYGWGLGFAERFAEARPWWVIGLWAGVSVVLVGAAVLWLRRFDRGPLELVMHRAMAPVPVTKG